MTTTHRVICTTCGQTAAEADWRCPTCAGVLDLEWLTPLPADRIDSSRTGVWRYRPLLPTIPPAAIVSLGEGATPLVWIDRWAARHRLDRVGVKLESANPTGSFKDRGTTTLVSQARALGRTDLVEDSSGNAGASVAAYAARGGLTATIFVPAAAPAAKRAQIARVGAQIVAVDGPREAVTEAALAAVGATGAYYAGHNANPWFTAGMATFAYELIEATGADPPRHLVLPVGGGSLLVGAFDGFRRWLGEAAPQRTPRLHAVQSDGCAPLAVAWRDGRDRVGPVARHPTVAGGITVERPPRERAILAALRSSRGSAVAVGDEEILAQRQLLATLEGLDLEPTSAAAFAGLARLARDGVIASSEVVVVAATGAGWKDP